MNHQDSGTSNLPQFTSNTVPFLPKNFLWFQLLCGDLITMPSIMVMLRFNIHSIHWYLPPNMFQIRIPLRSSQLMIMKCTNFYNSSTQIMMMIFWMLISRCFRLDYLLLPPQNLYSLYCVFS